MDALLKRAKRKYINIPLIDSLIALNSTFKDKYIGSLACSSLVKVDDNKATSRYCKRSWCAICQPIKTAVRLNAYSEAISAIEGQLWLTTLTLPNVPANGIRQAINHYRKIFRSYRDMLRKQKSILRGTYNIEITFNPVTRLFHPHIHILHSELPITSTTKLYDKRKKVWIDKHTNGLIDYWLLKTPTAMLVSQDTRECYNIIEAFKYSVKPFYKDNKGNTKFIPAIALDAMHHNIISMRLFQPFAIAAKEMDEDKEFEKLEAQKVDAVPGSYIWKKHDWEATLSVCNETGEILPYLSDTTVKILLTNYQPNEHLTNLLLTLKTE